MCIRDRERPELEAWTHDVILSGDGYSFCLHLPGNTAEHARELALTTCLLYTSMPDSRAFARSCGRGRMVAHKLRER